MKYFRRIQMEYGGYVDADGVRWMVEWCSCIYSPERVTPEQLGYEPYETQEAALADWGLEPYVAPEEELLTETTTNEHE